MINIISHFILFLIIIFYNGNFYLKAFTQNKLNLNFFEVSFFGLIFTSLISQVINFFFALSDNILYFNLILILILIIFSKNIKLIENLKRINPINILIILLVILNIYGSKFSDDLNHYHYSYISNTDNTNYIVGLVNLHHAFGNSSLWLIASSYLNLDYSRLQDIHVLNGLVFYLFLGFFFNEIKNNINNKQIDIFLPISFFIIIFVLLKYTRFKEFGIDRPSFLIMYFFILFYLKNFFMNDYKKEIDEKIVLMTYVAMVLFFIKISFFFIGIVPIYYIFKLKKFSILKSFYFFPIYFFIISYFFKNILISGCIIYPIPYTCIDALSWSGKEIAEKWYILSEILNKSWWKYSGDLNEITYIQNFNWIKTWFYTVKIELAEFLATSIIATLLTLTSFKKIKLKKLNIDNSKITEIFTIILIISFASLILFIFKNPVIRMSHYLFIFFPILFLLIYFSKFLISPSKKTIYSILIICLVFNVSKNFNRINDVKFVNNPSKTIKPLVSKQKKLQLGDFKYYKGWYGNYPSGNVYLNSDYAHKKVFFFDIIYKID